MTSDCENRDENDEAFVWQYFGIGAVQLGTDAGEGPTPFPQ